MMDDRRKGTRSRVFHIAGGFVAAVLTAVLAVSAPLEAAGTGQPSTRAAARTSASSAPATPIGPPPALVLTPAPTPPVIDGKLDDAIWSTAQKFDGFKTFKPDYGKDGTQRTEAYLTYDAENFYFAYRCYDTEPSKIKASISKRDSASQDDIVGLILDTANDQQSGFTFMLNPLGIQMDGIMNVQGNVDDSFDMVWFSKGVIDDQGWAVEARVPLRSLRFPNKKTLTMRALFFRFFTRTSEQVCYPPLDPNNSALLDQAQRFEVSGLKYHRVMEIIPAATYRSFSEASGGQMVSTERTRAGDVPSVTGKFGLTSDLTLDGAYKPDFSQVEADAGQVDINLRYANYYQEKRPFFLEGQDLWQFGGMMEDAPLQSLVYTRTIVNPGYGFRLTGKVTPKDTLAAIYARDRLPGDIVDENPDFTIARYRHTIQNDGYIGGFYTGREAGSVFNRVGGLDGRFRLAQPSILSFHLFGSWTRNPGETEGSVTDLRKAHAFGINYNYQTRKLMLDLGYQDISRDFQVDTGFLTRTGVRRFAAFAMYQIYPKSKFFQKIEPFYWSYHLYDTHDRMWETFNIFVARFYLPRSTQVRFEGIAANEVFAGRRFNTSGFGVRVMTQITKQVYFEGFARRSGSIFYNPDAPYQGDSYRVMSGVRYQPVEKLDFMLDLTLFDFKGRTTSENDYTYTIVRSRNTFQVNKYLFLRGIVEYNFFRKRMTIDPLVSFTYIPGTVFYVGYGAALERVQWNAQENEYLASDRFLLTKRGFFFKVSYLWRF